MQPKQCLTTFLASRRSLGTQNLSRTLAKVMLTPPWRVVSCACFTISAVKEFESGKLIGCSPWLRPQYTIGVADSIVPGHGQTWPSLPLGSALAWSRTFLVAEFLRSWEILWSSRKGDKNCDWIARSMHKFSWLYASRTSREQCQSHCLLRHRARKVLVEPSSLHCCHLSPLSQYQQVTEMGQTTSADRSTIAPLHSHCRLGSPGEVGFRMSVHVSTACSCGSGSF